MSIFIPDSETKLYGLLGKTLSHSISPSLHNNGFRDLGLNAVYLMLETKEKNLEEYIDSLKMIGFSGWNVTIPYKESIIPYLNGFSSLARASGAVNTVLNRRGRLTGYNTDVIGFQRQLEESGINVKDKRAVVIGAGGAARAVIAALIQLSLADITIINRTVENAEELAKLFREENSEQNFDFCSLEEQEYAEVLKAADLVVDTTPVGMYSNNIKNKVVINPEYLHEDQLVIDLVYNPLKTEILKEAEKRGAQIGNGLPTLIYQAEASFKLWTKEMPPKKKWYQIAEEAVEIIEQKELEAEEE
ncbi:Shikimate 5-dehydrogenase I alpha [Halanaerobium saccharolyticum subsp. saccharolyticum DSM 6643]|uniref:Shikimate dehydrogenase (NADP(+)) n=1 Tax=Halanaerobium saccharolyticum subsp. saccharolyticum DSM 6643 TaxID=1293054 RepID=M5E1E2_9FIRM|nr:shikimate dehydrogenase [Halanaerobium saccharolyticum]CCU79396.1 Shikimate 5-dehydrogenase I alpha [Halanaerobium saccharolyticum subsp. saccharolyticum DSM 6643]